MKKVHFDMGVLKRETTGLLKAMDVTYKVKASNFLAIQAEKIRQNDVACALTGRQQIIADQVISLTDNEGKKTYTNEAQRKAAASQMIGKDKEAQSMVEDYDKIRDAINKLEALSIKINGELRMCDLAVQFNIATMHTVAKSPKLSFSIA